MKRRLNTIKAAGNGGPKRRASDAAGSAVSSSERCALGQDGGLAASRDWGLDAEHYELLEFLEADLAGVDADLAFQERLRLELWWMILSGIEPGSITSES